MALTFWFGVKGVRTDNRNALDITITPVRWIGLMITLIIVLICIGLAFLLIGFVIPSDVCYAKRRVKPEWVMPEHYPDGFDGIGRINRILVEKGEVVIDEDSIRLSPYAEYHTPTEMNVSSYLFGPGKLVGFIIGLEKEIISMWLIEMD